MNILDDEFIDRIMSKINQIDYIKLKDIPNVDLYMDQVTTFMDKHLESGKRYETDKILTKTMINNYTKNNLMPPPDKKKYSKEHMLLLIFIYYFKNLLSMSDIQKVLEPLTKACFDGDNKNSLGMIYDEIVGIEKEQLEVLKKDIINKHQIVTQKFSSDEEKDLALFSFISMLSFDVYIKKQLIEQIIDLIEEPTDTN